MTHPLPSGWTLKRLGDITERITRKNTINNNNVLTISAEHGFIKQDKFFSKIVASKDLSKYILLYKGDFCYNKSYCRGYPYGVFRKLKNYDVGVATSLYIYFKITDGDSNFFEYLFDLGILNKQLSIISQEGVRNHGLLNVPMEDFFNMTIPFPPLEEQKRIAEVLSLCDDIIENLTELIDKKEQYKKLSGEVRFKGFTDEWETVRLGDLATITSAGVDKKINTDEKKVRLLNYLDVFNRNKLYDNEISFITSANDTQIEKCNIKKGDLFITPSSEDREGIAKSAVAMEDFDNVVYSYHIIRLRFNKEIDLKFKSYMCDTELFHRQAYRLCDGSGQRYVISLGTFREMKIYIPTSIEEQRKIGEFLSTIDNEIDNLKKQLELRKQQKKGLMQKLLTGEVRV